MKAGTIVRLPDGREGTAVYNGLDGVGIKWGRHEVTLEEIMARVPNPLFGEKPENYEWEPDAMLREPYKGCAPELEYVGEEFEIAV